MLQIKRLNTALVAALLVLVAVPSFGAEDTKKARKNDVATEYQLKDNGDLFRVVSGHKCQVTTKVLDFKVSQHPNDVAMIYFVRDENTPNLYVLHNAETTGNCPKTSKKLIESDLAKKNGEYRYNVVSNTDTTIVNVSLARNGDFKAFDDKALVLSQRNVADYVLHNSFGVRGAAFSSYVLFALNDGGFVLKVKGQTPAASNWDLSERYSNLQEFKTKYKIQ